MNILFEDLDLVVLDKPPGVVVNEAESVQGETLQAWAREQFGKETWPEDWHEQVPHDFSAEYGTPRDIFENRAGMVHRLDKDTSGVVVFAKHPGALVALLAAFQKREVQKTYQALVHGLCKADDEEISAPIGRSSRDRKKWAVTISGRPATTRFSTLATYVPSKQLLEEIKHTFTAKQAAMYDYFSLLSLHPKTGRTHQIRVHMTYLKHPLVGDTTYVGKKRAKVDQMWCPRHFLHASALQFTHPRTKKELVVTSPLPADLVAVLDKIEPISD